MAQPQPPSSPTNGATGSALSKAASVRPPGRSAKELAQDDVVMATNSSSIVSKRSVEKIYYPNEPHFFRYFVKKYQRRSPLINRGYHLRLHVIDVAVRNFLRAPSDKTKIVVNLGCGSDVLPWQCFTRYPDDCRGAKFVDVDFPDLLKKKCKIVQDTPELIKPLDNVNYPQDGQILLTSDQYVQIGCDLRELPKVEQSLASVLDLRTCKFLFVAEVSITYMETEGADGVIKWASSLGEAEFCLLEQILPDGADHPFAKTMLRHFDKLKAPPKSVFKYPTLRAQRDRFAKLGWAHADVKSLWQIWSGNQYLSARDRKELNEVEPFDEWEEFALFAGHYCVVSASTTSGSSQDSPLRSPGDVQKQHQPRFQTGFHAYTGTRGQRRFGTPLKLRNILGETFISNIFGLGTNTRLRSQDVYGSRYALEDVQQSPEGPSSRMCHASIDMGNHGSLLCGGRTSPSSALKDAWLFSQESNSWTRLPDLPVPLYRHGMTRLGSKHNMALVLGGKTDSCSIYGSCLIYRPGCRWMECRIQGTNYSPVFGAVVLSLPSVENGPDGLRFHGVVLGGMLADGTIANQALYWTLEVSKDDKTPSISFEPMIASSGDEARQSNCTINRLGAAGVVYNDSSIALIGGIITDQLLSPEQEILRARFTRQSNSSAYSCEILEPAQLPSSTDGQVIPRPLLVGISATMDDNGSLLVMGGGGVCFSMGSYWNEGCYTIRLQQLQDLATTDAGSNTPGPWVLLKTLEITDQRSAMSLGPVPPSLQEEVIKVEIPRVRITTGEDFLQIIKNGKPVVIKGLELGSCVGDWSAERMVEKVGAERRIIVHESKSSRMDFNAKNFSYVTKPFGEFMRQVEAGGPLYLRALSEDKPSDQPANLVTDFPGLAADFTIPDALRFVRDNLFSSVLRISGNANMWLHYDVMANVYCQIRGSKRLVLFPPSDVTRLGFAPGASSSSLDVFAHLDNNNSNNNDDEEGKNGHTASNPVATPLSQTHPHEAVLGAGEVLFLPALWLHTAQPIHAAAAAAAASTTINQPSENVKDSNDKNPTESPSSFSTTAAGPGAGVAVNIFFRDLPDHTSYAAGRDVYGNRDLAAYEKGRQDVARIARAFDDKGVPPEMKEFYVLRLAEELLGKAKM